MRQEVQGTKMRQLTRKIKSITEDNMVLNRLKIGCMLLLAVLLVCLPKDTVMAASGLRIYNHGTKREINYTNKQVKVTYNGTKVSVDATPGILVDGVALVSYQDVFNRSAIKADCVYDKTKGTVTISKFGTTIVMTLNSRTARVNGKAVTMPVAPVMIRYIKANSTKILVPSRFVSETLGYGYTWNSNTNTVAITRNNSTTLSYNEGKAFDYTGTQPKVTLDGKAISMGTMPNIIVNNTAMLRAKRVFADSAIKAKYSYNSSKRTVTLSKNGNELVMKIGDSVGMLNGKPIILDNPPMLVKNHETNTTFVMVPGSITAASLGYDYTWNRTTSTSAIVTRKNSSTNSSSTGGSTNQNPGTKVPGAELGDEAVVQEPSSVILELLARNEVIAKGTGITELNLDAVAVGTPGFIFTAYQDYTNIRVNEERFIISSNLPFGKITSSVNDKVLKVQAPHVLCYDSAYPISDELKKFVDSVSTTFNQSTLSSEIEFVLKSNQLTYDIALSEDKLNLYVTFYANSLNGITIGTNQEGDYITLTGEKPLNVIIDETENIMTIQLPNTVNGIGDQNIPVIGSKNILHMNMFGPVDSSHIILALDQYRDYYISEEGNQYTISFVKPIIEEPKENFDPNKYQIVIPRPNGIKRDQITHEDLYANNRFVIRIPGNHTNFFQANKVTSKSNVVTNIAITVNNKSITEIIIDTSKLQGYQIAMDDKNIYVRIGNPRDIYKNIVVLDPGHGGTDKGAQYSGFNEKDLNFTMLYDIGRKYFDSSTSPIKVYYTRTSDVFITLDDRAKFANKYGADLFVSLHMNAAGNASANGTEVFFSLNNNSPNKAGLTSRALATLMVNNLSNTLKMNNRGPKDSKFVVVHRNTVPAILIELGFMSNKNDLEKITNKTFQENSIKEMYDTLVKVFELYPTGR